MQFHTWFSKLHPTISLHSADAVLKLTAEGATVPFISRYRKEATGSLDEVQVQAVIDANEAWDTLIKRKEYVLNEINDQKKLTPELKKTIEATWDIHLLEEIYAPYKSKRKTKAMLAKEAGLEPFAIWIKDVCAGKVPYSDLNAEAEKYLKPDADIKTVKDVIERSQYILIEELAHDLELRALVKDTTVKKGFLKSKKGAEVQPNSKFEPYFDYAESILNLQNPEKSHRYLALRRGWTQKELSLSIGAKEGEVDFEESLLKSFQNKLAPKSVHVDLDAYTGTVAKMALKVHVLSQVHNEIHRELKELSDAAAIDVFARNVEQLMMASPFGSKAVLALDPGIRTGCKTVIVDDSGKHLFNTVLFMRDQSDIAKCQEFILKVAEAAKIKAIAVGNGTAGRETETIVRKIIKDANLNVPVVMVNESGASIYSASEVAREEFPDLDLTVRGAISIARRLQDPLAELVKIDPKSIGVGQYQHDVSQPQLKKRLDLVVDTCVNRVGVNLNTASYHLLSHVAGIGPSVAKSIVQYREEKGLFKTKVDIKKVKKVTDSVFEQASGFLRIPNGAHPLDNTGVHPERYEAIEKTAQTLGKNLGDLTGSSAKILKQDKNFVAAVGELTCNDIIAELEKPGRDPREEFKTFEYREDINEMSDLKEGMTCPGIVTNVTNFGAFVDIGVHQDGLVHISQLSDSFVKDPKDVVKPGDHVKVWVMSVDLNKKQIALSMKSDKSQKPIERASVGGGASSGNRNFGSGGKPQQPRRDEKSFSNNPFANAFKR